MEYEILTEAQQRQMLVSKLSALEAQHYETTVILAMARAAEVDQTRQDGFADQIGEIEAGHAEIKRLLDALPKPTVTEIPAARTISPVESS